MPTLISIRRLLLALLVLGVTATTVDLLLLAHYEEVKQLIPLGLNGLALATILWHVTAGGAASIRVLQVVMLLFVVAGLVGTVLHYQGNLEFQMEINADQPAWDLFRKVMTAKAPPALAPGAMTQLGFLGLIYSYRHPSLSPATPAMKETEQ